MLQEIRKATDDLSTADMLDYLLRTRFPGEVAVTASLKSSSVVVLKLISEIDPSTPVIFCQPQPAFSQSETYRDELVELLGLSNIRIVTHSDPISGPRPFERCERLWNEGVAARGRTREVMHLNDTLSPYKCWIKAAYHDRFAEAGKHRLDVYGGMVIVDVLHGRTTELVDRFMHAHALPYHPRIHLHKKQISAAEPVIGYHF